MARLVFRLTMLTFLIPHCAAAQPSLPEQLVNGGFEDWSDGKPDGWFFAGIQVGTIRSDDEAPLAGQSAALLDATGGNAPDGQMSSNLMQTIDAIPWRGKRVRFRAAVRTADVGAAGRAQLWCRVDRESEDGEPAMGAFDNMQDRPIRSEEWEHYDIVLDVADDASRVVVGMFTLGRGRAWIDDATLEEVDEDTETTDGAKAGEGEAGGGRRSRFQLDPLVAKALAEAEDAPQQPFFNHWLWLVLLTLVLFALSVVPPSDVGLPPDASALAKRLPPAIPRFALRFTVAYWLLYSLPMPFTQLIPVVGGKLNDWHNQGLSVAVAWTAEHVFKIEGELVPPNGSGDTTYSYINVFIVFVLALVCALVWSLVDRRRTDYRCTKDLLQSYLRYVLALTMMGYGLAKVAWDSNQFPEIGAHQLEKTWGDSSPMNVLWSFMGASRPYTIFAGLGEVLGGLLLLFRRTTTLGALVVVGVMVNVMMLNYCYDVPVKLYSTHLVCMALYLLMLDSRRLSNVLFWNRYAEPVELRPPYTGPRTIWLQRLVKLAVLVIGFGYPLYQHTQRQVEYFEQQAALPDYFGLYDVAELSRDGQPVAEDEGWSTVKFERMAWNMKMERKASNWLTIRMSGGVAGATFTTPEQGTGSDRAASLEMDDHDFGVLPVGDVTLIHLEDGRLRLAGKTEAGSVEAVLTPSNDGTTRLTGRGYRWINEVPFNR